MASHCTLYHKDSMVGTGKLATTELVRSSITFTLIESVGRKVQLRTWSSVRKCGGTD